MVIKKVNVLLLLVILGLSFGNSTLCMDFSKDVKKNLGKKIPEKTVDKSKFVAEKNTKVNSKRKKRKIPSIISFDFAPYMINDGYKKIENVEYIQLNTTDQLNENVVEDVKKKYESLEGFTRRDKYHPSGTCSAQAVRNAHMLFHFFYEGKKLYLNSINSLEKSRAWLADVVKNDAETSYLKSEEINDLVDCVRKRKGRLQLSAKVVVAKDVTSIASEVLEGITDKFKKRKNYSHLFITNVPQDEHQWYVVGIIKQGNSYRCVIINTDGVNHINDTDRFRKDKHFCEKILNVTSGVELQRNDSITQKEEYEEPSNKILLEEVIVIEEKEDYDEGRGGNFCDTCGSLLGEQAIKPFDEEDLYFCGKDCYIGYFGEEKVICEYCNQVIEGNIYFNSVIGKHFCSLSCQACEQMGLDLEEFRNSGRINLNLFAMAANKVKKRRDSDSDEAEDNDDFHESYESNEQPHHTSDENVEKEVLPNLDMRKDIIEDMLLDQAKRSKRINKIDMYYEDLDFDLIARSTDGFSIGKLGRLVDRSCARADDRMEDAQTVDTDVQVIELVNEDFLEEVKKVKTEDLYESNDQASTCLSVAIIPAKPNNSMILANLEDWSMAKEEAIRMMNIIAVGIQHFGEDALKNMYMTIQQMNADEFNSTRWFYQSKKELSYNGSLKEKSFARRSGKAILLFAAEQVIPACIPIVGKALKALCVK